MRRALRETDHMCSVRRQPAPPQRVSTLRVSIRVMNKESTDLCLLLLVRSFFFLWLELSWGLLCLRCYWVQKVICSKIRARDFCNASFFTEIPACDLQVWPSLGDIRLLLLLRWVWQSSCSKDLLWLSQSFLLPIVEHIENITMSPCLAIVPIYQGDLLPTLWRWLYPDFATARTQSSGKFLRCILFFTRK